MFMLRAIAEAVVFLDVERILRMGMMHSGAVQAQVEAPEGKLDMLGRCQVP